MKIGIEEIIAHEPPAWASAWGFRNEDPIRWQGGVDSHDLFLGWIGEDATKPVPPEWAPAWGQRGTHPEQWMNRFERPHKSLGAIAPLTFFPPEWGQIARDYTPPPPAVETKKVPGTGSLLAIVGAGVLVWWVTKGKKKK